MANPYDKFDPTSDVKDVALSFGVGANQLLKMAGDAYGLTTGDMDNVVSKQAQENIEYLQRGKSEKLKAAEARRKQATDAEEDTLNKAFTYVRETFTDPRLFLSSTAETTPSMVGAGGIGAGARVATGKLLAKKGAETATKVGVGTAVGAGAGMQAVSVGADQYRQVVDTLQSMPEEQALQIPQIARLVEEKGATLDEAKTALAMDLARSTGLLAGITSVATQMVPGGRTIEKTLVGGAGRKGAGMALAKRAAGAAVGAAGEGVQEAAEEGSGQFVSNVLARAVEPERELTKGVGEAMGAGFAGAAPLGAAAGAASRPSQSVSEGTQTAGMSDEAPTSAAISPSLEERPTVDLSKAEELNQDQFFAAINVRQANLLGGEPNPEDVKIVGEITSRAQIDPEKANAAVSAAQEAVSAWSEQNKNAPTNIRVIYDPGMAQNGYGIRGAFNRRTGEILINAAYATSPEIVEEVARHEWAHQTLASPEGQKAIVDFAAQAIPAEELADLSRRYGTEDKMVLVDEWIANNAEKAPGVIARIVQYIREWLSEFTNGAVKLSPQEAANVLLRTLREQQTGRVEPETVREEGTRMSLEKAPVAERRQEAFAAFKAANSRSDAVMEGGRLYSPAVRNRLKNLLATGEVDRRALDREVERNIPAARSVEIPTEENLPSLEEIRAAVDQSQRSKVGGASNIPAGDSVTVRQDVPAFSRYGVGVVTVQDSKGNKYYQPFVRFTEPVLKPTPGMEKASLKIGAGEAKTPTIVARGKMSEDQSLPTDLDTWTQVGYNPDRHSYMYDRATGRPVTGGSEAVQIGNTVFVKDPEFGEKGDFLYSLEKAPVEKEPPDYRGQHTAPGRDSAPAHDLIGSGVYPKDVYQRPDWYEQGEGLAVLRRVLALKDKPDAKITIYRAIPTEVYNREMAAAEKSGKPFLNRVIRPGDWVTIDKDYAKDHGESALNGDFKIVHKQVPASSIFTNGDSIMEWGYNPDTEDTRYSLAQTKTPEFKKFFEGSKAVDSEGEPLRMYHGTKDPDIGVFRTDTGFAYGPGAYFTPNPELASKYATKGDGEYGAVYPAYLSLKNPISGNRFRELPGKTGAEKNAEARKQGYDGVINYANFSGEGGDITEAVVFEPEQIVSATGNVGAFGQRPVTAEEAERMGLTEEEAAEEQRRGDIRFSLAQTKTPEFKAWFGDWEGDPENASKVVDEQGNPLIVKHGTKEDFNVFDMNRKGNLFRPASGGAWFAESDEIPKKFSGDEGRVMETYLNVRKPFELPKEFDLNSDTTPSKFESAVNKILGTGKGDWVSARELNLPDRANYIFGVWQLVGYNGKLVEALKKRGYDGIKAYEDGFTTWKVFEPTQIKSATGNVGAFGQRPVTAEEAQRLGMTEEEAAEEQRRGDIRFSLAQTKTPEFKKWFGDSKIVEPDGTPTVMYHGTYFKPRETFLGGRTEDFTVFRPQVQEGFMGEKVEGDPGLIFVSPSPEFATSFAGGEQAYTTPEARDQFAERRPGARVYPLFVKAENPFDYENDEHIKKLFDGKPSLDVPTGDGRIKRIYPTMLETGRWHLIEPLAGLIKKAGFDALYINEESTKNLAVFSPNQLKSATGNVGAFGQRPLTAEERERVGVSEEAAEGLQRAGDIRFSLTPEQQEAINDKKVRELDIPKLVKEGILTERYAELLQNLLETSGEGSETRIEVWGPGGMPPRTAGVYRGADDVIMISSGTKLDLGRVLLHEYVHALTITGLKYAEGVYTNTGDMILAKPRPGVDIKELRDASRDMYKLLAEARKAAAETKQEFYGFTNREEFVAEAFSNLKFQQFLSSIPSIRNKKKSLFDEFISIVKRIVGLSEDSLLTDVIAATDTLVGATRERVGTLVSDDFELPENTRFSLEKERTVEDQMKAMTTVKGPLKADSEGYLPEYITTEEALPTVVGGKNKTISVPFVSYNQYANTYFKSVSRDPRYAGKTVSLANVHAKVMQEGYSGFSAETYLEKDPTKAADMIVNDMAENLLFLHDLAIEVFGADVAKRMSKWYDGARVIAENLAKKYDISVSQSAAVLASLSPQKHWFANVSLAENVMDVLKNHQGTVFDADVEKAALKSLDESSGTPASKEILYRLIKEVSGKKLSELSDPDQIAFFTRFLSQYIHPSQAYIVTPEGKLTPGSSVAVAWSSLDITKNAIAAFLDGSVENLTAAIGGGHKVRNFYGNIRDPNSPLFYTSDTHNVAAALLIPLGGTAFEVTHNFGSNQDKGVDGPRLPVIGTTIIGLQGTYPMYVEAGRRAAEKRGILPRQMQSITWETVRILFPDDSKTKELIKEIKGIHAKVKEGKITLADARNEIVERMGGKEGIKARPPEWLNQ